MKKVICFMAAVAVGSVLAGVYGDIPDAKHAWAVHDMNRPTPAKVSPSEAAGQPPSDAIVLFDGSRESLERNWSDAEGRPTKWAYDAEQKAFGIATPCKQGRYACGLGAIRTREEFGDCQLHLEFRHPAEIAGKAQMRGNTGVFLMGNYEIQILESFGTDPANMQNPNYADGIIGSVYAENPPLVNACRRPGEWQSYDIIFHQPVWQGSTLLHPGSVTVLLNGVLVQDHWEMEGFTTHCRRRSLAPHATKGPLSFQDHGCPVFFRNVWYRPLASRWANTTHSAMSAKEDDVMALRRATAAKLYAKLAQPLEPTVDNMLAMAEVISYAKEGEIANVWQNLAENFHGVLDRMSDAELEAQRRKLLQLRDALDTLIRGGAVRQACGTRIRINAISLRLKWEKL